MNKRLSKQMLYTLQQIGESTCTGFGYNNNDDLFSKRYLHTSSVHALINRGLLELAGSMHWDNSTGTTPIFRVSEAGKQLLSETKLPELPKDETWKQTFAKGEKWTATEDIKTYPDWESAQAAMDRGETVRVEMEPFQIDPALVQLAIDLQHKERFEQWKAQQQ